MLIGTQQIFSIFTVHNLLLYSNFKLYQCMSIDIILGLRKYYVLPKEWSTTPLLLTKIHIFIQFDNLSVFFFRFVLLKIK